MKANGPGRTLAFRRRRGGFSLLEILLVIALLALLSTALISGANAVFRATARPPPEEVFWQAVLSARQMALFNVRTVTLRFDDKEKRLRWTDGAESASARFDADGPAALQFLQPKAGSVLLLGGQLVETAEVPAVRFYSDGTCDAFRAQVKLGEAPPFTLAVDPWTCAPMLEAKK